MKLRDQIRTIPDFPIPGIRFRDITPLLADPIALAQSITVVQQGYVGVVQRFGRYVAPVRPPGVTLILPFIDRLVRVDMRETPRTGDRPEVVTAGNVAVALHAPLLRLLAHAHAALFALSNHSSALAQ